MLIKKRPSFTSYQVIYSDPHRIHRDNHPHPKTFKRGSCGHPLMGDGAKFFLCSPWPLSPLWCGWVGTGEALTVVWPQGRVTTRQSDYQNWSHHSRVPVCSDAKRASLYCWVIFQKILMCACLCVCVCVCVMDTCKPKDRVEKERETRPIALITLCVYFQNPFVLNVRSCILPEEVTCVVISKWQPHLHPHQGNIFHQVKSIM